MIKRMTSALLWFIVGCYGWAFIAAATGLTPHFGPVLGAILAAFVAGDPLHLTWTRRTSSDRVDSQLGSIQTEA
jgi:hypothetical protein